MGPSPTDSGRSALLEEPVAHVLGMRRGEPDAQQGRNQRRAPHQLGKVDLAGAVGVDVLPQQGDFAVTVVEKRAHLGQDGLGVAAPLAAAGVGHHAVGAEVVAAAHDGDEGADAVLIQPHRGDFGVGLLGGEQHVDPLAARLGLADQARQIAVGIGPGDDVDPGGALDELLSQTLGHAADDADDERGTGFPQPFHLGQAAPDALLGVVADGAGIDEDDVGLLGIVGMDVALLLHDRDDDLRIADVHLAAVGLEVELTTDARKGTQRIYTEVQSEK